MQPASLRSLGSSEPARRRQRLEDLYDAPRGRNDDDGLDTTGWQEIDDSESKNSDDDFSEELESELDD